ncbi:phospholipase A2 inhibitor gamma subunit B-like [Gastrophryne carolinensis]
MAVKEDDITLDANFVMACSPREQCDTQGSVSIPHGKIKRSTTCCYSDNCTPETPQLSEDDPNDNGLICATCVSANSDSCYPENTMRCTGKENMCLLQTTYTYAPVQSTIALRGCATKSLCDLGTQKVSFGQVNMTMKFKCSSSGSTLRCPLFLVSIITLTVIKMFYV